MWRMDFAWGSNPGYDLLWRHVLPYLLSCWVRQWLCSSPPPPPPQNPQCFIWHVHTFPSPRLQFCLQFLPHGGVWGVGHCFKFCVLAELLVLIYVRFAPQALVCRDDLLCWMNWTHFSLRCCSGTELLVKDSHEALFWDHILFPFGCGTL